MPRIILGLFIYLAHSLTSAYASIKLNHQDGDGPQKRPLGGVGRNRADVEHMHGDVLSMNRSTLALKVVYVLTPVACCDLRLVVREICRESDLRMGRGQEERQRGQDCAAKCCGSAENAPRVSTTLAPPYLLHWLLAVASIAFERIRVACAISHSPSCCFRDYMLNAGIATLD